MRRCFFLCIVFAYAFSISAQMKQTTKNYETQWQAVAAYEKKSLPQSASAEVNKILRQAIADKNSPQVIKALIHQGKYDSVLDNQKDTLVFVHLNEMLSKSSDPIEQSVLHSMLGELYLQYYQNDRWNIDQRTQLSGFVPGDMNEWTKNIFYDKAVEHVAKSVAPADELLKVKVEHYAAVIELGKDSRRFFPTMYDFLAKRAIELFPQVEEDDDLSRSLARKHITQESLFAPLEEFVELPFNPQPEEYNLWALEMYRRLLSSLSARGLEQSTVLIELEKTDYLRKLYSAYENYAFLSLEKMVRKWEHQDFSVEIVDKMADIYQAKLFSADIPGAEVDNIRREKDARKNLYELLRKCIDAFPRYERITLLKSKLSALTQPSFSLAGENTYTPESEKKLNLTYQNLSSLKARLYRVEMPVFDRYNENLKKNEKKTFVKEISVPLPPEEVYLTGKTAFSIDIKEPGAYKLEFEAANKQVDNRSNGHDFYFSVSDLAAFGRSLKKDRYEFFVVNRSTGKPVKNAKINIYKLPGNWNNSSLTLVKTILADEEGLAVYQKDIPNYDVFYQAVVDGDRGSQLSRLPSAGYYFSEDIAETTPQTIIDIFTDRSIYRPGQTVHFKAIARSSGDKEAKLVSGKPYDFILYDTNRQEQGKQTLTTNEYGSVAGEFVLPQGVLTGSFFIETEHGRVPFRVEEYKRPTFEVTFDKIDKTYKFNEQVTLKGAAQNFSGIKLQRAEVAYRVSRQQLWWGNWGRPADHFAEGVTQTDDNGAFEITFTPQKTDAGNTLLRSAYSFRVEASVTDVNGETQTGTYTVAVGDVSMILQADISDKVEKNSDNKLNISAKNLDGNDIPAEGTYQLFSLQENDSIDTQIWEGRFVTGEQKELKNKLKDIPSGKYKLVLKSKDDRGNEVIAENSFVLYSYADARPPIQTNDWFIVKNGTFGADEKAEVILGVSDENVHVLYELWKENTLLERKWIVLNNENRLFSLPYKASYGKQVTLMLSYVKKEKFYTHRTEIELRQEKKELKVSLDVFRDKIRPGSQEEWRLTVKDNAGNPAVAEVLASMYDFSLDKIFPSVNWNLSTFPSNLSVPAPAVYRNASFGQETAQWNSTVDSNPIKAFEFDVFNWFGLLMRGGYNIAMLRSAKSVTFSAMEESSLAGETPSLQSHNQIAVSVADVAAFSTQETVQDGAAGLQDENAAVQIRRRFDETAFFYPQLRTNEKGETQIAFTVPESNTRWRFRVLAHDKNLNTGSAEAFAVSQKELMVTPNMPRFLRHGDRTSISTKISNLSSETINGTVTLEFFDPVTDEVIKDKGVENQSQPFSLAKDVSSDAAWTFDVPSDIDIIGVRIVARSDAFSDGELHALPVLPNRMMVMESLRLDVNGNETKEFSMDQLVHKTSGSAEEYRLTLEFASNPAWYAVQALPVLSNPQSDNAVSWFASYYAYTLGYHISQAYPNVARMIDVWKKQGGDADTFLSNLEKNEELKNVLLEETPWVLEAKNESEQKQKLSLLFDLNRSTMLTNAAIDKLKDLQASQGGWSWFKGFRPDVTITHYILYGFDQLKKLEAGTITDGIRAMQAKAVSYIDSEALSRFEELKKGNRDWRKIQTIPVYDLEYLYVRSAYPQYPVSDALTQMTDFYTSVLEKNWTRYGLYERAIIAQIMHRKGNASVVNDILRSYREHATTDVEQGMFWANNRSRVFMSQSAVSVHTFIMEAFQLGGAKPSEMDGMKRWLLKQKQTQQWESTHATMDAVYALLNAGNDWFSSDAGTAATVVLGGEVVEPDSKEAGTGYFKKVWNRSEIRPEMGQAKVIHQGNQPAWGALYRQYFEELDKIVTTDASLDVEKRLFTEQTDASGTKLVEVNESRPLKIGDKVVVRLTVRTDRDIEFVHLKDMRGAFLEPVEQISGVRWQGATIYYQATKDASTNFYFDHLSRGVYVLEYAAYVTRTGDYSNGIATIQCLYAPEFTAHTAGMRVRVEK